MEHRGTGKTSRREVLKKAGSAAFIAPVLMSFKVSEVKAKTSFPPPPPPPPI